MSLFERTKVVATLFVCAALLILIVGPLFSIGIDPFISPVVLLLMLVGFWSIAPWVANYVKPRQANVSTETLAISSGHADEPGIFLGVSLIGALVVLPVTAWSIGIPLGPHPSGMGPVFMGLFLIALGLTFLASCYLPWRSFFLRWLLKFCTKTVGIRSRTQLLFVSGLSLLGGLAAIFDGLGMR